MHDSESDMSHPMNKNEEYCESLKKIGIDAEAIPLDTDDMVKEDYYSKIFFKLSGHGNKSWYYQTQRF